MLIDLHNHTFPKSTDSIVKVDDLIDLARQRGLDGVCLTEHNALWQPEEVLALQRKHNFLILPGIEVTTERGHMLSFGLTTFDDEMYTFARFAERVAAENAVIVVPHPFRGYFEDGIPPEAAASILIEKVLQNPAFAACVAIETMNGRCGSVENEYAVRIAEMLKKPATAGSEMHDFADVARCATEFERRIETVQDLIDELRAGRFHPVDLNMREAHAVTDHEFAIDESIDDFDFDE